MTDKTTTPRRIYSKSSAFYIDTKRDLFDANDTLLIKAGRHNELYNRQPPRTLCKICSQKLPTGSDFLSHQVRYVFCLNCGNLNGTHCDTESFATNLYIQADGADYAKDYLDPNFVLGQIKSICPSWSFYAQTCQLIHT